MIGESRLVGGEIQKKNESIQSCKSKVIMQSFFSLPSSLIALHFLAVVVVVVVSSSSVYCGVSCWDLTIKPSRLF